MSRPFLTVFSIADDDGMIDGKPVNMTKLAVEAVRQGYAVIPLKPGSKVPNVCSLTAKELKEAGKNHPCGVRHAITDDKKARSIFTRFTKTYEGNQVNIGIVVGPSRLINIDADNEPAVKAFLHDWAEAENDDGYLSHEGTVITPGSFRNGEWHHKDGRQWWFEMPADFDWENMPVGMCKDSGGYDIRWGWQQSAAPPSRRPEGTYKGRADVLPCPQFIMDKVLAECDKVSRNQERVSNFVASDSIGRWSASVSWEDLLVPDGWSNTGKPDRCGCPIFEKPGGGSTTYKSATGHHNVCDQYPNPEGHGPLHLWTSEPPPPLDEWVQDHGQTITKLHYAALTRYDGDIVLAKIGLGIDDDDALSDWANTLPESSKSELAESIDVFPDLSDLPDTTNTAAIELPPINGIDPVPYIEGAMKRFNHPEVRLRAVKNEVAKRIDGYVAKEATDNYIRAIRGGGISLVDEIDDFANQDWDDVEQVTPTILTRTDGKSLLIKARVNYIVGRAGIGKTWAAMFATAEVLNSGGSVLYVDMEDRLSLFRERMAHIGCDLATPKQEKRFVYTQRFPTDITEIPSWVTRVGQFDLVVFDVLNRMVSRLDGDIDVGNNQIIWLTDHIFDSLANLGAAVLLLDHPNKKGQRSDSEVDDMRPGGGATKSNNASGIMLGVKSVTPFRADGTEGHLKFICLKDRTGHYAEGDTVGEFKGHGDILEPEGVLGMSLRIDPPENTDVVAESIQSDVNSSKQRIRHLLSTIGPLKVGSMKNKLSPAQRAWLDIAIEQLMADGEITLRDDGQYHITE